MDREAGWWTTSGKIRLLEFVYYSVYVDLWYNKISLTFTAGFVWSYGHPCLGTICGGSSDCDACAVCVGCEYAERVWECKGDDSAGVGDRGSVVAMSAGHESMGGTPGSDIVSSADDVLEMSIVHGMRGVCYMCMCLAQGRVGVSR